MASAAHFELAFTDEFALGAVDLVRREALLPHDVAYAARKCRSTIVALAPAQGPEARSTEKRRLYVFTLPGRHGVSMPLPKARAEAIARAIML